MSMTEQQLLQILPNAGHQSKIFISPINAAMSAYGIVGRLRTAAFIAQIGHESGQLKRLVESLNYKAERIIALGNAASPGSRWRSLVPYALELAGNPVRLGNAIYSGRMGNGSPASGEGYKYRGRGLIQVTGKANYLACGRALGVDLVNVPALLEEPQYAAMSAAWYWSVNGLNTMSDAGDLKKITQFINGAQSGAADRAELYALALRVLS